MPITDALKLMEEVRALLQSGSWHLGRRVGVEIEELYELLYRLESHLPHDERAAELMEPIWEHVEERGWRLRSMIWVNAELLYDRLNRIEAELPRALEGREWEAAQREVAGILATRFGSLPAEVETELRQVDSPHELEQLVQEAARCESLTAFAQILNPLAMPSAAPSRRPGDPDLQEAGRAKQDAILQTLSIRFFEVPDEVEPVLRRIESLETLDGLFRHALSCETPRSFREELERTQADAGKQAGA